MIWFGTELLMSNLWEDRRLNSMFVLVQCKYFVFITHSNSSIFSYHYFINMVLGKIIFAKRKISDKTYICKKIPHIWHEADKRHAQ